ncbi:MAG: DEAD/DEAH box helicase [Gallionella sp.]|nr:DEAD/DEAH box helicase [Gallionella sp.]MDD4958428.1 DEAD/DEAH box helicase [Gallionella sp.]
MPSRSKDIKTSKLSATTSPSSTPSLTSELSWDVVPQPWHPHKGQKAGVKFLIEHAAAGLFADPGVGKTSITLGAFKFLKKRGVAHRMLIIAPLRPCYLVWPAEVQKWADFNELKMVVLHGPKKEDLIYEDADIFVINPEGLQWLLEAEKTGKRYKAGGRRLAAIGADTLVVDELSKFKYSNTSRFKMIKPILSQFQRRWGLTGSPAANGLEGLFGQIYMLDQGRTFGPYITHFRQEYFIPSYDGFGFDLKKGAEARIYERLQPIVLRQDANDFVDMPDLMLQPPRFFELPKLVRKIYDQLEDECIFEHDAKVVSASNAAVAMMKCRQVAGGAVYADEQLRILTKVKPQRDVIELHDLKVELLKELIEELQGKPLLVGYEFRHDLARIQAALGKEIPYIGSGVNEKQAKAIERDWNKGLIPVLLGNPQSVGHGLNLQGSGCHVCWFTLPWDYELYDQFNRRVYRQGNKNGKVFIHHLAARDTVDELIWTTLQNKRTGQTKLFDALKKMRGSRKSAVYKR